MGIVEDRPATSRLQQRLRDDNVLVGATWSFGLLGIGTALVAVIVGSVMMAERVPRRCTLEEELDATGTPHCYSHPHAGLGGSVVLLSITLIALTALVCLFLLALPSLRQRGGAAPPPGGGMTP